MVLGGIIMAKAGTTRYFSSRQEKAFSELIGGKVTPNSGASHFAAGDVLTEDFVFECKTPMTKKKQITFKKEWIEQNEKERMGLMKPYSAVVFNFEPDGKNYVAVDENTFKIMLDSMNKL